jgi:hypothetical protein
MNERNARAALMDLRQFLAESGASLQTIDAACSLGCTARTLATGRLEAPCLVLVSVPDKEELEPCVLRAETRAGTGRHGGSRVVLRRAR